VSCWCSALATFRRDCPVSLRSGFSNRDKAWYLTCSSTFSRQIADRKQTVQKSLLSLGREVNTRSITASNESQTRPYLTRHATYLAPRGQALRCSGRFRFIQRATRLAPSSRQCCDPSASLFGSRSERLSSDTGSNSGSVSMS
jgi:hypothetical protein